MIKIEHLETLGWEHAIRGLRNPLKSWKNSDSGWHRKVTKIEQSPESFAEIVYQLGENDLKLALKLVKAGASHRKFLRHISIYCDIRANLKFYDEFDTYLHVVKNSTSQMHGLGTKKFKFTVNDFSNVLTTTIAKDNMLRTLTDLNILHNMYVAETNVDMRKKIWRDMIEINKQSFLYTRTCMFNYEVFISMYFLRKDHKMIEWRRLMKILRRELPYMNEIITALEEKKI